jgi:hypothetical protein
MIQSPHNLFFLYTAHVYNYHARRRRSERQLAYVRHIDGRTNLIRDRATVQFD